MTNETRFRPRSMQDLTIQANKHNKLGFFYQRKKNYSKALEQFKAAFQIAEQIGESDKQIIYLNNIGGVYKVQGNTSMVIKIFLSVLKIARTQKNHLLEAITLNRIGLIYHDRGNYFKNLEQYSESLHLFKEAMNHYHAALEIAERIVNNDVVVVSLNNMAGIFEAQGNYAKALKTYQKALKVLKDIGLNSSPTAKKIRKNIGFLGKIMNKNIKMNHRN